MLSKSFYVISDGFVNTVSNGVVNAVANRVPKCDVMNILFLEYFNFGLKF